MQPTPTRIYRSGKRAFFAGTLADAHLYWPDIANYHAIGGHTLTVDAITQDENVLKLFTEAEATGLLLLQQGYFLLHASSVVVDGRAYVFCGTPGAGKSTTVAAFVKAGYAPLADDMTIIGFDNDNKAFVVPQGPSIKIWDTTAQGLNIDTADLKPCFEGHNKYYYQYEGQYPTEPIPLEKIYLLHRSKRLGLTRKLKTSIIVFELLKHFPLPHQLLKSEYLQTHFKQSLAIAQSASVISQKRPEGYDKLQKWIMGA